MNTLSGFSDQVKVQVEIEQSQRGLVGRQRAGNRVFIDGLVTEEDLDGFRSRLIDLPCTRSLISIAQVKPDNTDQLIVLSGRCRLFQEWNGHDLLLRMVLPYYCAGLRFGRASWISAAVVRPPCSLTILLKKMAPCRSIRNVDG